MVYILNGPNHSSINCASTFLKKHKYRKFTVNRHTDRICFTLALDDRIAEGGLRVNEAEILGILQEGLSCNFNFLPFVPIIDCQVCSVPVEAVGQKNSLDSCRARLISPDDKVAFLHSLFVSNDIQVTVHYYVVTDLTVLVVRCSVANSHADVIEVVSEHADVATWSSTTNQEWPPVETDVVFDKEVVHIRTFRAVGVHGIRAVESAAHYAI